MNPAEVPILVGASPDSVVRWSRKRRRSSIDTEERMWVRCEFGKGNTMLVLCVSCLNLCFHQLVVKTLRFRVMFGAGINSFITNQNLFV